MKIAIACTWEGIPGGLPPLTAIHLAALCPPDVDVEIWHERVQPIDLDTDADLIALSATTPSARRMYTLADHFRARGAKVILGGPHVSLVPTEAAKHADVVVIGDGDRAFPQLIRDFERGDLKPIYRDEKPISLEGLPIPRYDLLEGFPLRCVVQATRGCPYHCDFCTLKGYDKKYRVRPIHEVLRDIQACEGRNYAEKKLVLFWDDNLLAKRAYAKELLAQLVRLNKWWYAQCTIDVALDRDLVRLAADSGCIALFFGIESFSAESLADIHKRQNKVANYRQAIKNLHDHGIAVHAGLIVGLDTEPEEHLRNLPKMVEELGIDFPFLNMLTPFPGTPLYDRFQADDRLLYPGEWHRYRTGNVVYRPRHMSAEALEQLFRELQDELYSVSSSLWRVGRSSLQTRVPSTVVDSLLHVHYHRKIAKARRTQAATRAAEAVVS